MKLMKEETLYFSLEQRSKRRALFSTFAPSRYDCFNLIKKREENKLLLRYDGSFFGLPSSYNNNVRFVLTFFLGKMFYLLYI